MTNIDKFGQYEYKLVGHLCKTDCKYHTRIKVGSNKCFECEHFIYNNSGETERGKEYIMCKLKLADDIREECKLQQNNTLYFDYFPRNTFESPTSIKDVYQNSLPIHVSRITYMTVCDLIIDLQIINNKLRISEIGEIRENGEMVIYPTLRIIEDEELTIEEITFYIEQLTIICDKFKFQLSSVLYLAIQARIYIYHHKLKTMKGANNESN